MKKSRYNAPSAPQHVIRPADQAKGDLAEFRFRDWLDASRMAHVYLDQTPISVPEHLRGQLKRPDYQVGIPGTGTIAFDVKAKSIYNGYFIFEYDEICRMRTYARLFHQTVYFACLDPEGSVASYWLRLDQFDNLMPVRRGRSLTVSVPAEAALPVSMLKPFQDAFRAATELA